MTFMDPPSRVTGVPRSLVTEWTEQTLRANPGRWMLLPIPDDLRGSKHCKPRYLGDEFEWTQRQGAGGIDYYCRFVGGSRGTATEEATE